MTTESLPGFALTAEVEPGRTITVNPFLTDLMQFNHGLEEAKASLRALKLLLMPAEGRA